MSAMAGLDWRDDLLTPDDVKAMLEDAGKTLMMLPMPRLGRPAEYGNNWPDVVRTYQEWFTAQVMADLDTREEMWAGRNVVRVRPLQKQIDEMQKALELVYSLEDERLRKVTFARMLKHPVSDRYIVSYAKLGRIFGLHRNTMIDWHERALLLLACRAKCAK